MIDSFPAARELVPGLEMVVVCGPRIDPAGFEPADGLELVPYVHQLSRHLAACDVAVVQGGLTTCMELAAAGTPFLYFPLRRHFEQNLHVRHRLERYGAGRAMDFETSGPEEIAAAIADALAGGQSPAAVERHGASRAAGLIADLF
jgi:UDP:flavonoid glycosyltransferase YjiC (YdhE family)